MGKCLDCNKNQTHSVFVRPCNTTKNGRLSACDFIQDTFFQLDFSVNNSGITSFVDIFWLRKDDNYITEISAYPQTMLLTDGDDVEWTLNHIEEGMYVIGSGTTIPITEDNIGTWTIDVGELSFILANNVSCTRSDLEFEVEIDFSTVLQPLIAIPDSVEIDVNTSILIPVLDNDLYANNITGITLTIESQPINGTATVVGNEIQYTPAIGFCGKDSFLYQIEDSAGQTSTAVVTIGVKCLSCPNDTGDLFKVLDVGYTVIGGGIYINSIKLIAVNSQILGLADNGNPVFLLDENNNTVSTLTYNIITGNYDLASPVLYTGGSWTVLHISLNYTLISNRACFVINSKILFSLNECEYFAPPALNTIVSDAILMNSTGNNVLFNFNYLYSGIESGYNFEYSDDGGQTWVALSDSYNSLAYNQINWSLYGLQIKVISKNSPFCEHIYPVTTTNYTDTRATIPVASILWTRTGLRNVQANAEINSFSYNPPILSYSWNISLHYQGNNMGNVLLQGLANVSVNNIMNFSYTDLNGVIQNSAIQIGGTYKTILFERSTEPLNNININVVLVITDANGSSMAFTDQHIWTY